MKINKKITLLASILTASTIMAMPLIAMVNNVSSNTSIVTGDENNQITSQQIGDEIVVKDAKANNLDSNVDPIETNSQVIPDYKFIVGAEELEAAGWGTNITGSLIFTVLDDIQTVSVIPQNKTAFAATNFNIQGTIINDGTIYNVTTIGGTFEDFIKLDGTLTIPASVTSIGASAFYGCKFTSIKIDSGNQTFVLADNLGANCYGVVDKSIQTSFDFAQSAGSQIIGGLICGQLELPNNLTTIGDSAFSGCSNLTGTLIIPANVTSIGAQAFNSCSGLTGGLTIPASVTTIGTGAFNNCKFTSIKIDSGNQTFVLANNLGANCYGVVDKSVEKFDFTTSASTQIIGGLLYGQLELPNNLTSIGDQAFANCSNLTGTLVIPASVTSIGANAFGASGLKSLDLINATSLQTIDTGAFSGCSNLTGALTIPASVTSIGNNAFNSCKFASININSENKTFVLANNLGAKCYAILKNGASAKFDFSQMASSQIVGDLLYGEIEIPAGVTSIGNRTFYQCSGLMGTLTIPASVTSIGDDAFGYCTGLTGTLTIPASVTSIGEQAFSGCFDLSTLNLTNATGLETIGFGAFNNCRGLTSVTIPSSVTTIGEDAFSSCSGLMGTLTIPASVTSIGSSAFSGCVGLTKLDLSGAASLTSIGDNTFEGCTGLSDTVVVPASVTSIGDSAFSNCSSLTSVTIPSSVITIGEDAFSSCSGLTTLDLSSATNLQTIGNSAFGKCTSITILGLSNATKLTTIGGMAFAYCSGLTGALTIPASVTSIGEGAFAFCDLNSVNFLSETFPQPLGEYAFGVNNSTITINIPKGARSTWIAVPDITVKLGIVSIEQIKEFTPPAPTGSITLSGSQGSDKIIAGTGGNIAITATIDGTLTPGSVKWEIDNDPDASTDKLDGITLTDETDSGCKVNVDPTVAASTYHVILLLTGTVNGASIASVPLKLTITVDPVEPTNDLNLPLIIGISTAAAIALAATIGTVTYVIKRNKKLENK